MKPRYKRYELDEKEIVDMFSNSIMPVGLSLLKKLSKDNLIILILTREKMLYKKIDEWNNSIKHNDRIIFKTMKKEIENLQQELINRTICTKKQQD